MESIIVGFSGKARHGKDTAAKAIMDSRIGKTYDIKRYAFADELKREVDSIGPSVLCFRHGIEYDAYPDTTDPLCTTLHGKQSKLLQFYGQMKREEDPFYWIKRVRAQIEMDKPTFAFVTDMRYLNEYYFCRAFKGHTVKVTRKGFVDLSRDADHASETELDTTPFQHNLTFADGELEQLKHKAVEVFQEIVDSYSVEPIDVTF